MMASVKGTISRILVRAAAAYSYTPVHSMEYPWGSVRFFVRTCRALAT